MSEPPTFEQFDDPERRLHHGSRREEEEEEHRVMAFDVAESIAKLHKDTAHVWRPSLGDTVLVFVSGVGYVPGIVNALLNGTINQHGAPAAAFEVKASGIEKPVRIECLKDPRDPRPTGLAVYNYLFPDNRPRPGSQMRVRKEALAAGTLLWRLDCILQREQAVSGPVRVTKVDRKSQLFEYQFVDDSERDEKGHTFTASFDGISVQPEADAKGPLDTPLFLPFPVVESVAQSEGGVVTTIRMHDETLRLISAAAAAATATEPVAMQTGPGGGVRLKLKLKPRPVSASA